MSRATRRHRARTGQSQRGFTLLELLAAMVLALFLLGGLLSIVQTNRRVYAAQTNLSQQEDSERFAMLVLGEVIQGAGFFPNPLTTTAATAFPNAAGPFASPGQFVTGTGDGSGTGAASDTVTIQFNALSTDGLVNCDGSANSGATAVQTINAFSINANQQLVCQVTTGAVVGAVVPLVDNVAAMQITYGVLTTTTPNATVDTYKKASQMTAADWQNVASVKIRLRINNALSATQAGQPATVSLTRVICLLARA